jgi:hypothetical protein
MNNEKDVEAVDVDMEFKRLMRRLNRCEQVEVDTATRKVRFRPKLEPEWVEIAKKHKERVIEEAIRYVEGNKDAVICRACYTPISEDEPHISLERDGDEASYPFHTRYSCQFVASIKLMKMMEPGEVVWTHLVHACDEPEKGYDCEAGCFR